MSKKRDARRDAAQMHIATMLNEFIHENMDAVATRKRYKPGCSVSPAPARFASTEIEVADKDSVSALLEEAGAKAVMDFASYHNPGGGYENGAWAQEEALCSESNLYVVLNELYNEYYRPHKRTHNNGLYTSDALYLRDIVFMRDDERSCCDVIVMAAPNAKEARRNSIPEESISSAMRDRVHAVLDIAADNGIDVLVAGAFGCGVFSNSPYDVACFFKEWIDEHPGVFRRIVFGIPAGGTNYDAFSEVFSNSVS